MWFISAVGLSDGIAFHEKAIVFVVRPVIGRTFHLRSGIPFAGDGNTYERRHEEEKPVRQRRRRRVPGGILERVRRV